MNNVDRVTFSFYSREDLHFTPSVMEGAMSTFKRIAAIALMTAGLSAALTPMATPAQARDGFNGALFGGLAAGALVGGAIAGAGRGYAYGPRPYYEPAPVYVGPRYVESDCFITKRPIFNRWGDFVGYSRVRECD